MSAIFKREFKSYFCSPMGYVYLAGMIGLSAAFFTYMLLFQVSQIQYVFSMMMYVVIVATPLLTMRLFSEEKKQRTDQLLLTSPVSIGGIAAGKYLAAFLVFLIGISPILIYALILAAFTPQDWNVIVGNFVALALLGGALIAIGLLVSSLTESQVVAGIVTLIIMVFILILDMLAGALAQNLGFLAAVFSGLSFMSRYTDLVSGILNVAHLLFFLSVIVGFVFLTVRVLEKKRWS